MRDCLISAFWRKQQGKIAAFLVARRESRGLPPTHSTLPQPSNSLAATANAQVCLDTASDRQLARAESWTAAAISSWSVNYLATTMELPPERIDVDATFASLGMDSTTRTDFILAIEALLNVTITTDDMIERPTVAQLSGYLARRAREADRRS